MKNNKLLLLAFLAGVSFLLLLGAFTRDWDEATPTDSTVANQIDDYNRYLRVDASDRLKEMIYGFTAGENSGNPGIKELIFKQQAAAPGTPNADEITLYSIDDGANCALYAIQEDGYTKQLLKKVGTDINFVIEAADIPADLLDSQHYAALSIDAEHLAADIIDETKIADDGIDSEHYNDGSIDPVHLANYTPDDYTNDGDSDSRESVTAPNGMIMKTGYTATGATSGTITFGTAFSNGVVGLSTAVKMTQYTDRTLVITDFTTADIDWACQTAASFTGFWWIAIGY